MSGIINKLYDQIIQGFSKSERVLLKLSDQEIDEILDEFQSISFQKLSKEQIEDKLTKLFCIMTNTQTTSHLFAPLIQKSQDIISQFKLSENLYILMLGAFQKQIVDHAIKTSERIPIWANDNLKLLLKNKNPEVLEWTLRTIESMGFESLKFYADVKHLRPSILKIFNKHQKNAYEILELLEKQWARMKR